MFFVITTNMMFGGRVIGASSTVTPNTAVIVGTLVMVGALVWLVRAALRRQPEARALSLVEGVAQLCAGAAAVFAVLVVAAALGFAPAGRVGGPLTIGAHEVSAVGLGARSPESDVVDAARVTKVFGPQSAVVDPPTVRATVTDPSAGLRWAVAAVNVLFALALFAVAWAIAGIARRARTSPGFVMRDVRALRIAAFATVVAGPLTDEFNGMLTWRVFDAAGAAQWPELWLSFLPVGIAIVFLALAEVWRHGLVLQQEVEATV
jgi:Protein of unknown function (DUF2975)